jgi:hypothetical protein
LYLSNKVNTNNAWLQFKDKVYFYNDGTATIGGWNIDQNQINSTTNKKIGEAEYPFKTFMQNGKVGTNAFGVCYTKNKGKDNEETIYPFRVTHKGELHASGADIEGNFKISASSTIVNK